MWLGIFVIITYKQQFHIMIREHGNYDAIRALTYREMRGFGRRVLPIQYNEIRAAPM